MAKQPRSLLLAVAVGAPVWCAAPAAWAKPPKLTSVELQASRCPANNGGPRRCAPQNGFSVIETKTDMSDFRMVVHEERGFQIFLEPAGCDEVRYEKPLQWRLYDDEAFAVIQAAECVGVAPTAKDKKKPSKTIVVVRGLPGFEGLSAEFDASKNRSALRDAVEAADKHLKAVWPKIEERRVAAEAAADKEREKLSPAEDEEESAAAAPVPAVHKRK